VQQVSVEFPEYGARSIIGEKMKGAETRGGGTG